MAIAGLVLAIYGIGQAGDSAWQIIGVLGGFILFAVGIGTIFDIRGIESRSRPTASDTPAKVRLLGAAIALGSLFLPYVHLPLETGVTRVSYSFIDLVGALYAGTSVEGGFLLLLLMSIVIAGAFISLLHHIGGYLVLFGVAGYGYLIMESLGAEAMAVVVHEFQLGLYVGLVGGLIIAASSLLNYKTVESGDFYGSGR